MNFAIPLMSSITALPSDGRFRMGDPMAGLAKARQLRSELASYYDEAISYAMPGRQNLSGNAPSHQDVYDDTAVLATPEFASRIQQGVIPNFAEWTEFVAGVLVDDADEKATLKTEFEKVSRYVFKMINASNFASEANEALMDLAVGTMALRMGSKPGPNPINARYIPVCNVCFGVGPDGAPDPIFEERKFPIEHLRLHYPDASMPANHSALAAGTDINWIDVWQRDWSRPNETVYRQSVILESTKEVVFRRDHEGDGCNEIIIARWSKAGAQGWGRGPLLTCLSSIRKCNYAERALMDHTEWQLAGIWDMEDDGVVNIETVRLVPGTIIPRAPGTNGLQNVAPPGNMEIAQFTLEGSRMTIKKALFTEQLGNPNKTPMSATEVSQRMAELARAIGSPFGRIIVEFVIPAVIRALYICKDRGLVKMPQIDGKNVDILATSPLAQAQRYDKLDAIQRWVAGLQQAVGPERAMILVDDQVLAEETSELYGTPARLLRSKAGQAAVIQQMSAIQGAQGGGAQGQVEAGDPAGGA